MTFVYGGWEFVLWQLSISSFFVVWDVSPWGGTLKIEKIGSAETLVLCYQITWCHFLVFSIPNCTYWSIGLLKALNFILLEIKRRDLSSTSGLISVMRRIHIPPPPTILLCASVSYWMERIASWCGRGRKSIIEQFGQDLFTVGVMIWDFLCLLVCVIWLKCAIVKRTGRSD
jgi:hypothetical protein